MWGANGSPARATTNAGRAARQDPDSRKPGHGDRRGRLDAVGREDTSSGSVLNHVLLHQTVIGLEAKKQFRVDDYPDVIIGCAGGGSNFAGLAFPFVPDKLSGKKIRIVAVEPTACPTLTRGIRHYDFGDVARMTPLLMMYTLGHDFVPSAIHAGGLRYHGMAPLVSELYHQGLIEAKAYHQNPVFAAATLFANTEGIVPAPESSHAIRAAIDEAERCKREGRKETIVFNLSGHGHFDLSAYEAYMAGKLEDYDYPEEKVQEALARLENL